MSRLTNEHFSVNPPRNIHKCRQEYYIAIEDKLRMLENIEDEWGIGLDVLYKALTNPIVYIREDGIAEYCLVEHFVPSMKGKELHTRGRSSMMHDKNFLAIVSTPYKYGEVHLGLKDYRKMKPGGWALSQEDFMREETK